MHKIVVYRTHIEINDYTLGDAYYLEKQYSIWNKVYHRLEPKGMIYDSKYRKLLLPRGADIIALEKTFGCEAYVDNTVDPYRTNPPIGIRYTPRDNDQLEAIKFMLGKDQYYNNQRKTMLAVNLNTGKGKSYCAIATIAYMGLVPIIITDTNGCLEQWRDYFKEYTDIKDEEIFYISGSGSISRLLSRDVTKYKVFLAPHMTLKSYGDQFGWDKIHELFIYLGIGLKIYDEAHKDFDNMMQIDYYTNSYLTYYLTATLARSSFEENIIFQNYFRGVPSIDLFHQDVDPHTSYVGIKFNSYPSPLDVSVCKNAYGLDRNKYTDYLVQQDSFQQLLHIIVDMTMKTPGKVLWYIGTNASIQYVQDWLYENYPELVRQVGIYTSITPKELKKEQLSKKLILSTTKSAGAAMDIKGLSKVFNIAEPFKSRVLAQQTFGRTRAEDTMYIDLVDTGFLQTKKYYNFKKPVYMKYATDCREVILRQMDIDARVQAIQASRQNLYCPIIFEDDRAGHEGEFRQKLYCPIIFDKVD